MHKTSRPKTFNRRSLLFVLPGALLILNYQNCSHFNAGQLDAPAPSSFASSAPLVAAQDPNLIWGDDFDQFSLFDPVTKTGNWAGTSLVNTDGGKGWGAEYDISPRDQTLAASVYSVGDGALTIRTDLMPSALAATYENRKYISGALRTRNPSFGHAYFEMRAQLPAGRGMWPAFWLLPADGKWPPEIDIVEGLANSPSTVWTTVHTKMTAAAYAAAHPDQKDLGQGTVVNADTQVGFHTYGCDFRADWITFYFDGKQTFRVATPNDLIGRQMYIVLDTAVGGWNNNRVDATTTFPARFVIDYVRVFKQMP